MSTVLKLASNRDGATAIEWALIATLISLAAIVVFQLMGTSLTAIYSDVASKL